MNDFISVRGKDLLELVLEAPGQDPDEVILTEKGKDYTANQLATVIRNGHANTMFHIPRPKQ